MGSSDIFINACPHPFRSEKVSLILPEGFDCLEMLELVQPDPFLAKNAIITINERVIEKIEWETTRLVKNDRVIVRTIPIPGKGGGGKDILKTVFTIAIVAASVAVGNWAAAFYIPGTTTAAMVGGIVTATSMTVGMLALNAIIPPPTQNLPQISSVSSSLDPTTYSLETASNQARPFQPIPIVLGFHRFIPPLGAKPYTEVDGNDQLLHMCVTWGYGRLKISDLKIGDTDIDDVDGVDYETLEGYSGDGDLTLYPGIVNEAQFSIELTYADGWQLRTTEDNIDRFSFDITCNGLCEFDDNGRKLNRSVSFQYQYSIKDADDWSSVVTVTMKDAKTSIVRKTVRVKPASSNQYDVRIKRISEDTDDSQIYDLSYWTALRSVFDDDPITTSFSVARSALRVPAGVSASGTLDNLSGLCKTYCLSWSGAAWVMAETNNPADLFRYVLQCAANADPVADAKIDLVQLAVWSEFCTLKGLTYNAIIGGLTSVKDMADNIASCGRAFRTMEDGKWSVMIDTTQTVVKQHFSPRNAWGFSSTLVFKEIPHAWRIPFNNEDEDYETDERLVLDDDHTESTATNIEQLQLPGVTDPDQIYQLGRYHLAVAKLRPEIHSFNVDIEHLVCGRGDLVRVALPHALIGTCQGRIKSLTTDSNGYVEEITIDEYCDTGGIPGFPFPTNSLVGYWSMDETSGSTISDSSGNGNDGTITGTTSFASGISGNGLDFAAAGGVVDCGSDTSLRQTGDKTISLWYRNDDVIPKTVTGNWWICENEIANASGFIFLIVGSTGRLWFRQSQAGASTIVQSTTAITPGTLQHLCVVVESNNVTFYIDGVDAGGGGAITEEVTATDTFKIGYNAASNGPDGLIDEFRIYNKALSLEEVQLLYNFPAGSNIDGNEYALRIRQSDGTSYVHDVDSVDSTGYTVTLSTPIETDLPEVGDLCFFGVQDLETIECIVKSITPSGGWNAKLELVDYSPAIFTSAESVIPDFDTHITPRIRPPVPIIESIKSDESVMVRTPGGFLETRVLINLRAMAYDYDVEVWQKVYESDTWQKAEIASKSQDQVSLIGFDDGVTYSIKLRYIDYLKLVGDFTTVNHTVQGQLSDPSGLTGFSISVCGGVAMCRWDKLSEIDVIFGGWIEFRHCIEDTPTWNTSVSIGNAVKGNSTTATLPLKPGTYYAKVFDAGGRSCPLDEVVSFYTKQASILPYADLDSIDEGNGGFNGLHDGTQETIAGYLEIDQGSEGLLEGTYTFQSGFDFTTVVSFRLTTLLKVFISPNSDLMDDRTTLWDTWEDFDGTSNASGINAVVFVRTTDDDPDASDSEWSEWQWLDSGEFYARGCEFKIVLTTESEDYNIAVTELIIKAEDI